jgi:methionine sulfoxide reductase heme-binding subunit
MSFPSPKQTRWIIKPIWFAACLAPFIWMNLEAFGMVTSSLGDNPIEATQQFMGAWALRMLLLTLAISPCVKIFKLMWLMRFRRMTGLFSLFYAVMHFLNYAGADKRFDWSSILQDVIEHPFIVFGAIGLAGLILLGFTSTKGWQRRLGQRWNKLHRLIYPITLVVAVHFCWEAEGSYYETGLYIGVILILLGYRLLKSGRKISSY